MTEMRIAVLAEFFYPAIGGQEQRLLEILELMKKRNIKIDVFTIRFSSKLPKEEIYKGINIYRIIDDFNYRSGGGIKSRSIKTIILYSLKILNILKRERYDKYIYTQFPVLHILCAKLFSSNQPRILDFVEFREGKFWRWLFSLEIASANAVSCISNSVKKKCEEIGDASKLTVIPSSIDIDKYSNNEDRKYFLFVGRMEPHKHPEDAIESVIEFNKKNKKNYFIHLIGDGSLLACLKDKYSGEKNIVFHGFVSEFMKIKIAKKALIMIFPSEREGLPVSVVECMAAGIPTVTTNYANNGTKDFVSDYGIGVVSNPNIPDIVSGIENCMNNYDIYKSNCLKAAGEFSSEKAVEKFLSL